MNDAATNTTNSPPPPPPIVHYYCGGTERAVCGTRLTLDKAGPCFSTRYDDATCEACRRACPPASRASSAERALGEAREVLGEIMFRTRPMGDMADAAVHALTTRALAASSPGTTTEARAWVETRPSALPGFLWKRIALGWWGLFAPQDVHAGDVWDVAENNRRAWEEHERRRAARGIAGAPEPYDADDDADPFCWHTWNHHGVGGENASDRTRDAAMRSVEAALVRQRWHGAAPESPGSADDGTEGGR
jgi:hypothetical protein